MTTTPECYPCFARQILNITEKLNLNETETRDMFKTLFNIVTDQPVTSPPPQAAMKISSYIKQTHPGIDLYLEEKQKSNEIALTFIPELTKKIEASEDKMLQALKIAILGNIIDYGIPSEEDSSDRLKPLLDKEEELIKNTAPEFFNYKEFEKNIKTAKKILYITDNCGEIILDSLLIKEIAEENPEAEIICAVRDEPILNDATKEDAELAGIKKFAKIISSGSNAPGTLIPRCNERFMTHIKTADIIVSKGQGNYETLSDEPYPIYFLLMAKCEAVAKDVGPGCKVGNLLLLKKH